MSKRKLLQFGRRKILFLVGMIQECQPFLVYDEEVIHQIQLESLLKKLVLLNVKMLLMCRF